MLRELEPGKLLPPLVQDADLPGLRSRLPAEAAGAQSPHHGRGLGQQRELVHLDPVVPQAGSMRCMPKPAGPGSQRVAALASPDCG